MLMRFEPGAHPGFHRALPALAVLLQGELMVKSSAGDEVSLLPGDAIRVEPMERGTWRLGNPGLTDALFAVVPMPPPSSTTTEG
jgi:quercetin dioxygenase-like cupin family protein